MSKSAKSAAHLLRFWGVRGSIPTADPEQSLIGGNTSCVELTTADGSHIIFDGGTGLRGLGNHIGRQHNKPYEVHLFLSHTHWDHIMGIPFFAPLHQSFAKIHIYGPERASEPLSEAVLGLFRAPYFPLHYSELKAHLNFIEISEGETSFGNGFKIKYAPHPHPNGAISYRLEVDGRVITYITDIEHTKDRLVKSVIELSREADVLIHDSQYHADDLPAHRSWGHSSWEECTAVAQKADVKELFLYHFDPNYSDYDVLDMERRAQVVFPHTTAARQGMTFEIPTK
ncbi:MAG: MBL fold metallo-hydrolase [Candidatus Marinimicrobia bacterium]|nr:MBL fold metallo-hydrolase [Candidatus Neomarinimicrobiota bacterium]